MLFFAVAIESDHAPVFLVLKRASLSVIYYFFDFSPEWSNCYFEPTNKK